MGNPHGGGPPPRSAPNEVGAERSSDGEVARTTELRRPELPGRARPWSAARARGSRSLGLYQTFVRCERNFPFFLSHDETATFAKLS